jgi:hypothetical protein
MALSSSTSSAARTSLIYITLGALIVIWTGVWFAYLRNNPPHTVDAAQVPPVYYWCGGLGVTGIVLIVIGLTVGHIGRTARAADLPAAVATPPMVTGPGGHQMAAMPVEPVQPTAPPAPAPPPAAPPPAGQAPLPPAAAAAVGQQPGPGVVVAERR